MADPIIQPFNPAPLPEGTPLPAPNPYLDTLRAMPLATGAAPSAPSNPYLQMLQQADEMRRAQMAGNVSQAVKINPDQYSAQRRVAKYLGYPVAAVEAMPDITKQQAQVQQVQQTAAKSPALERKFTDADFAKLAHDDTDVLGQAADLFRAYGKGVVGDFVGATLSGAVKMLDAGARAIDRPIRNAFGDDVANMFWYQPARPGGVLVDPLDWAREAGQQLKQAGEAMGPKEQSFATDVAGGLGQVTGQIGLALTTGGASLGPLLAQGFDFMDELLTRKAPDAVVGSAERDLVMAAGAAWTGVTEKYALDKLLGPLVDPVKRGFVQAAARIGLGAATEGLQEMLESVGQDVLVKLLNPESKLDFTETLYEGGVGATVGGIVAATIEAVVHSRHRSRAQQDQVAYAEEDAKRLQQLLALAAQSKLRERSPESFAELVQEMASENDAAPTEVRFDARTLVDVLNQSGVDETALAQVLPSVVPQLQEALAVGGEVTVPLGELTKVAGTELEQALLENARIGENELSQAEAKQASEQAAQFLEQEAKRVVEQATDTVATQAAADNVKQTVLGQLNSAKRFTTDVNEAYAGLVSNFYTVMGQRLGMTPDALYARYPLRVQATGVEGDALKAADANTAVSLGGRTIPITLNRQDANAGFTLATVDAAAFDAGFKAADTDFKASNYVGPGGEGGIAGRYERFAEFSRTAPSIEAPTVSVDEEGRVSFGNGRHRFAYMRDNGVQQIPVAMDSESLANAQRFGYVAGDALEQRGVQPKGKTVPTTVDEVANVESAFQFAGTQSFPTNRDFKLAIQERVLAVAKAAKVKLDEFSAATEDYLVRIALADGLTALRTNANAVGWYNEKVTKALRLVSLIHPEIATDPQAKFAFVWAMAVTSNGLKVDKNFELAEQVYQGFKKTGQMPTDIGIGTAAAAINRALALYNTLIAKHGFETVERFMTTMQTVKDVEAFTGMKVSGENLTTQVYGAAALGPKIGNGFFMNLYGRFEQLTMDRWLMRTWGRWTGTLVEQNPAQVKAKRTLLKGLIQSLSAADKKAFESIIKRKLTVGDIDEVAIAIWKASQKPANRAAMSAIAALDDAGNARLTELLGEPKKGVTRVSFGDELRKAGNALTKYLDGQKEAPSGPPERGNIRKVFARVLAELQKQHPALTMSDYQALLWYPEKRLYDAAKTTDEATDGYEDDEAPDYANAAAKLARAQGVSDDAIAAALAAVDEELQSAERTAGARPGERGGVLNQSGIGELNDGRNQQTGDRGGRDQGGSLAPLEGAPVVAGATGPDPRIVAVAEQYARDNGIELRRQGEYARVDPERAARIAAAYEEMRHAPTDPKVKEAYDDLIRQTLAQYRALEAAGYKFYLFDQTNDPYAGNPWNAMRDLRGNQVMGVFSTEAGFGTGGQVNIGLADPNGGPNLDPQIVLDALASVGAEVQVSALFTSDTEPTLVIKVKEALTKEQGDRLSELLGQEAIAQRTDDEKGTLFGPMAEKWGPFNPEYFVTPSGERGSEVANPLLVETGVMWPYGTLDGELRPVRANDLFRAVHDAFGHGMEGAGFRAQGEENAWQAHVRLFTGPAVGAITSETRGQNSWLNFGPYGEQNRNAKVEDTVFADQKIGLMPEWTWTEGRVPDAQDDVLEQGPRGTFSPSQMTISLLEKADLSTFLHETGHFFMVALFDMASQSGAPVEVQQDVEKLLKWFGIKDLATWNGMSLEQQRKHHERWAESFEQYLLEGKAPSAELQPLFQRFRSWLINVYKSLTDFLRGRDLQLSDEVRGVMDRLIATEEQIKQAEEMRRFAPLFKSAKEAGMSPEAWAAYQAQAKTATDTAIDELQARSIRDMRWTTGARSRALKALQKDAAAKRKAVEAEVRAEVEQQSIYRAMRWLRKGEMTTDEGEQIKAEKGFRLSTQALAEMYPESALDRPDLERLKGMTAGNGLHPDMVAEMFGFASGDQLVRSLIDADSLDSVVEGMTDQRMLERYGDLATEVGIQRAADEAVHNEARGRFIAGELKALRDGAADPKLHAEVDRQVGRTVQKADKARTAAGRQALRTTSTVTLVRAAKQFASNLIAQRKVRDLKPGQHAQAETRAAKQAEQALAKGDAQAATVAKQDQLLNHYAARETNRTLSEIERAVEYLKKFDKESVRKKLPPEYLDQIDKLLERVDLRKLSNKDIDKRAKLAAWIEEQRAIGIEPEIPDYLLEDAQLTSYRDMTVEAFRGLVDTVKQIEHLGRLKNKLLTAKDQREFDEIRERIVGSILGNAGNRTADTRTPTTNLGRALQSVRQFGAAHIKVAAWARIMDGGKDGGPVWEYFIRSANEAGDMEATMVAKATEDLAKILAPLLERGKLGGKGQHFPSIGRALNRESILAIALNVGNESNLQRLLGGEGWTLAQIKPVLDTLTQEDWAAVQSIWDYFETFRPLIAEKEKRVFGKEPNWIDAGSVLTDAYGVKGGYYPVKYDPAASQRAEEHADAEGAKRQLQGAYGAATTRRSFTKTRAEEVNGRPLLYTLQGVYSGVSEVIHDLAWHEWLIDTNRLLRSKSIDSAMREKYGPEVVRQFKSWRDDIAEGDAGPQRTLEMALGKLRQSVSVAGLGFNVMSALMQPLGFTQSIVRIGPRWVGRGLQQSIGAPFEASRMVNEKSKFMANRARTRFRELNELRNRVQGASALQRVIQENAYRMMMAVQRMVDVPTWIGAYEKAIADGQDEKRAVALADQAVIDAQGGGQTKDLASIERGSPALKLFTVFYSFMNTSLNLAATSKMTPTSKAKFAVDMLLLSVIPAVLGNALKNALTPGDAGDDDEELAKKLAAEQLSYLLGMVVLGREFGQVANTVTGAGAAFDYAGPAGLRAISDVYKFSKQAAQGEFDDAFRKSAINLAGDIFGIPSAQINRSITGAQALAEGKTSNPAAVVLGYQEPR